MNMTAEHVYIVHLTDLHFGEDLSILSVKLDSFYSKLAEIKSNLPDKTFHVVITGDFINKYGTEGEKEAEKARHFGSFLEKVQRTLKIDEEKFVFCLGNHDKCKVPYHQLLSRLKKETNSEHITYSSATYSLSKSDRIKHTKDDFDNRIIEEILKSDASVYFINPYAFLKSPLYPTFRNKNNSLVGIKKMDGIDYLILNSAWMCFEPDINSQKIKDEGNLSLGIKITKELLQELRTPCLMPSFLTIGLMHHSFGSMHLSNFHQLESNSKPLSTEIFSNCDLLLNGHEHGELFPSMGDMQCYIFRAGTLLSKEDVNGYNTFSLIHIDFSSKQITKTPIYYDVVDEIWKNTESLTLDFPNDAKAKFVNHKIQINQYFTNLKSFIINELRDESKYIAAEKFIAKSFNFTDTMPIYVCDLVSLELSDTLNEYMNRHSEMRTKVLLKIENHSNLRFVEPLELYGLLVQK